MIRDPWTRDDIVIMDAQLTGRLHWGLLTSRFAVEVYQSMKQVLEEAGYQVVGVDAADR